MFWIQQDPASTRCVPAAVTGLGEPGGMVRALMEHPRSQALRGGDLPRSHRAGKGQGCPTELSVILNLLYSCAVWCASN